MDTLVNKAWHNLTMKQTKQLTAEMRRRDAWWNFLL